MPPSRASDSTSVFVRAHLAAALSQTEVGRMFGVSRRTIIRWTKSRVTLNKAQWRQLLGALHAKKPDVAAALASELGESLVTLGVVPPPPPPVDPSTATVAASDLPDLVLFAAADAAGLAPAVVRPALAAALDRAASLGLSIQDLRAALSAAAPAGHARRGKKA